MRIALVHPNYHSGGAEIAGNWPPAWAAYIAGSLKTAGYEDVHFVDAMTNDLSDYDSVGYESGQIGNAATFDGEWDALYIDDSAQQGLDTEEDGLTLVGWVKCDAYGGTIASKWT